MQTLENKLKVLGWQGGTVWQANEELKKRYLREFQFLKPWDEAQKVYEENNDYGYWFLMTAGHGYLIVPKDDNFYHTALNISRGKYACSFNGDLAIYLEEDCEAPEFLEKIKNGV